MSLLPTLEIWIPISPTENFFTMTRFLAASIRSNGGKIARRAKIVVLVGADEAPRDLEPDLPWSRGLGIEWRWVDRVLFRQLSYYATAAGRFKGPFAADLVMMLDADVIVAGALDELLLAIAIDGRLSGLIAHRSPEFHHPDVEDLWPRVFDSARVPRLPANCEVTGWGHGEFDPHFRFVPPYFNLGVLAAPRRVMEQIGNSIFLDMAAVDRVLQTVFKIQIAVTLAIARYQIDWRNIGLAYNFPSTWVPEYELPRRSAPIRIFHYIGAGEVWKQRDFADLSAVGRLLRRRDLNSSNQAFCAVLKRLYYRFITPQRRLLEEILRRINYGVYTDPRDLDPMRTLVARHRFEEALDLLRPHLRRGSANGEVWYLAAFCEQHLGHLSEAERKYRRAMDLGFDEYRIRFNRAVLYQRLGHSQKAEADFARVHALRPADPDTKALKIALAWLAEQGDAAGAVARPRA